MKKVFAIAGMMLAIPIISMAQSSILQNMVDSSSTIIAATCDTVNGGMTDEEGVEEWTATCRVDMTIKGKLNAGDRIFIHFNRFTFGKKPEPLRFTKGERFVVFLDGQTGTATAIPGTNPIPVYRLLDRWLSVQAYEWYLVREIKQFVKTNEEIQQAAARTR